MSELEIFAKLAAQAREEPAPEVDVVTLVLQRVYAERQVQKQERQLLTLVGLSLVSACVVTLLALPQWEAVQDPLSGLFAPLYLVLQ